LEHNRIVEAAIADVARQIDGDEFARLQLIVDGFDVPTLREQAEPSAKAKRGDDVFPADSSDDND
jgi:hypothetical protein